MVFLALKWCYLSTTKYLNEWVNEDLELEILSFPVSSAGKESACNAGNPSSIPGSGRSPGEGIGFTFHFHALEKEMATYSSVLAWRVPGTGEPGGLPSMGSHRVKHDWSDLAAPTPIFLPGENPHGQRSLAGYSPWGCKELDTTEATKHTRTFYSRHREIFHLNNSMGHITTVWCQYYRAYREIKTSLNGVMEKEVATHSSTLAWKMPRTEEPGRLQSTGSRRVEESGTTKWLHFHFSLSCIGGGSGNPLQCSCLENPRDGGAW